MIVDLNTVMCHCDLLISDYSGAVVDFLITAKANHFIHTRHLKVSA
jgi:CDP-glycerol glycerophosphotransferase (TagB/SpsB family)